MSEFLVPRRIVNIDGRPLAPTIPGFSEETGWKNFVKRQLGDLDDIELLFNDVLVAKYEREKVSEHLVAAAPTRKADMYEGVVGLVLKLGATAFLDDERNKFHGARVAPGDWVLYRASDGWDKDIQAIGEYVVVHCRILPDAHIRGRVRYPGRLY